MVPYISFNRITCLLVSYVYKEEVHFTAKVSQEPYA
jgi:hypothetical protein